MQASTDFTNRIKVQTNQLPRELTQTEIHESARSISLYYRQGDFICQTFFTPPILGKINYIEGLDKSAQVYFREIQLIGPNLFHVRLVGAESDIRDMCRENRFYELLKGLQTTFNEQVRTRRYLETTTGKDQWDLIVSLDKKTFWFANYVRLEGKDTRLKNIIIVGDRLLGLTDDQQVVSGQLTPDIIEQQDLRLEVTPMKEVNEHGKVDVLENMPNTDDMFLATIKNGIYQFTIWGDLVHYDVLDDKLQRINSVNFNHTRSIMATNEGIYEMDVSEMPNMVKVTSLPRQIANPHLRKEFKTALYVDDPYILGVYPAVGIFAKTRDEKVVFF